MQIMDLVMQYFPASCCFLSLWPNYHPQYSVAVNPPYVFPLIRQTTFRSHKNNTQYFKSFANKAVISHHKGICLLYRIESQHFNPYPTAFPYGNGMVLHFYQQQESSTTKTVHKVINKGLKTYV